jgi:hypothetical protein
MDKFDFPMDAIATDDLAMLQRALKSWCAEKGYVLSSPEADKAALELIDWYYFGITNEPQLLEMMRSL